mgnify:CR=1 FL=1
MKAGSVPVIESFAYHKLGYQDAYELGPQEIVKITPEGWETLSPAGKDMRICAFLWTDLLHLGHLVPHILALGHEGPGPGGGVLHEGPGKGLAAAASMNPARRRFTCAPPVPPSCTAASI